MAVNQILYKEILCGVGGLNLSDSIAGYPESDLRDARGIIVEDDTWQKEGGADKINDTAITDGPTVMGLHDFWASSSTQKKIAATSDGKIVEVDSGGIAATLKSGLGTDKQTVFVEAVGASSTRKLFAFNGYDQVQVTSDGVTTANLTTPASDWSGNNQPTTGVVHNNRLWALGNANDLHRVYYSTTGDHEDFTGSGSGSISVYPGEGEKLVALFSYRGRIFLWKYPVGIYWIDDTDTTPSNWVCHRLTRAVGMAGPLGLSQTDDDVFFISAWGFPHSLGAVEEYGDVESSSILSEKIGDFIRDNVKVSAIDDAVAVYYPTKMQWQVAVTGSGYTYNNMRIILDLHDKKNPRYSYSTRDECTAMTLMRDSDGLTRPVVGDRSGFLRFLDETTRNKDGTAYIARFETPDVAIIEKGVRRANLQFIEAIFRPEGEHDLSIEIYLDGEYKETITMEMGSGAGGSLGTFTLGTDVLGGGAVENTRKRLTGDCRRIRLVCYNSGLNENFSISSIIIGYTVGSERV